jgi:hypothetical protein
VKFVCDVFVGVSHLVTIDEANHNLFKINKPL